MEAIAKSKAGGGYDVECWRLNDPKPRTAALLS